jgi:hypothetical protein
LTDNNTTRDLFGFKWPLVARSRFDEAEAQVALLEARNRALSDDRHELQRRLDTLIRPLGRRVVTG